MDPGSKCAGWEEILEGDGAENNHNQLMETNCTGDSGELGKKGLERKSKVFAKD